MSGREIVLVGNPNAGKSTLFNALTHGHAHTGNWHGVTVGAYSKTVGTGNEKITFTDLPGVYSLQGFSMEEKLAVEYVSSHKEALFIDVIDVRNLKRSLALFKSLTDMGASVLVVLTMCKDFLKRGGKADCKELSRRLGVPVIAADAFSRKEIASLSGILRTEGAFQKRNTGEFLALDGVYFPAKSGESVIERICASPIFCLPIFFLLVAAVFFVTFGNHMPGAVLKNLAEELICDRLCEALAPHFPTPAVCALVCDGVLRSVGGVLSFLPQIAILYSFLFFLEESGYLSVLAFSADGVFRKLGLSGRAVFCLLLGFGCTAQAILATRGFEDGKMQRRTISVLPYIPCSAKMPVYLTLFSSFFARPFVAVFGFWIFGTIVALLCFAFQAEKGGGGVTEVARMRLPDFRSFFRTIAYRLLLFVEKIGTVVLAFTVVVWFVSSFDFSFAYTSIENSMLAVCCNGLKYVFYPIGVTDWQTTFALFSGLIAKENVAGLLQLFYPDGLTITLPAALSLGVFLLFCSPCVSAVAASAREIGTKRSLFNAAGQTVVAVFASYLAYFSLLHIRAAAVILCAATLFIFLKRFCFERIHRNKRRKTEKFYG